MKRVREGLCLDLLRNRCMALTRHVMVCVASRLDLYGSVLDTLM